MPALATPTPSSILRVAARDDAAFVALIEQRRA